MSTIKVISPYNEYAEAYKGIQMRAEDAQAYCQQFDVGPVGGLVWHLVLDDAFRTRKALAQAEAGNSEELITLRARVDKLQHELADANDYIHDLTNGDKLFEENSLLRQKLKYLRRQLDGFEPVDHYVDLPVGRPYDEYYDG